MSSAGGGGGGGGAWTIPQWKQWRAGGRRPRPPAGAAAAAGAAASGGALGGTRAGGRAASKPGASQVVRSCARMQRTACPAPGSPGRCAGPGVRCNACGQGSNTRGRAAQVTPGAWSGRRKACRGAAGSPLAPWLAGAGAARPPCTAAPPLIPADFLGAGRAAARTWARRTRPRTGAIRCTEARRRGRFPARGRAAACPGFWGARARGRASASPYMPPASPRGAMGCAGRAKCPRRGAAARGGGGARHALRGPRGLLAGRRPQGMGAPAARGLRGPGGGARAAGPAASDVKAPSKHGIVAAPPRPGAAAPKRPASGRRTPSSPSTGAESRPKGGPDG